VWIFVHACLIDIAAAADQQPQYLDFNDAQRRQRRPAPRANVAAVLRFRVFLNGALVSNIVIDTSQAATDTVDYVNRELNYRRATVITDRHYLYAYWQAELCQGICCYRFDDS
jgi:hypothetical protein